MTWVIGLLVMNLANAYCRLIQKWRKQNRFINVMNTKWTHLNLWMFYDVWISSMCICGWPVNLVKIYHLLLSLELNFFFLKYHLKGYFMVKMDDKKIKKKKRIIHVENTYMCYQRHMWEIEAWVYFLIIVPEDNEEVSFKWKIGHSYDEWKNKT